MKQVPSKQASKLQQACLHDASGARGVVRAAALLLVVGGASAALSACGQAAPDAPGVTEQATVYCPDFYQIFSATTTLPWGAVGYLNNGCTAVLIDPHHIAAAAHCAHNDNATWQTGLRFYPNFDPTRANPPRYSISRAVVGTLAATGWGAGDPEAGFLASDWSIMRLDCAWNDTFTQQWCPPVVDFPSIPALPMTAYQGWSVYRGGYDREPFALGPDVRCPPYGDELVAGCAGGGSCPCDFDPANDNHRWWNYGLVDPSCVVDSNNDYGNTDDLVRTSCSTTGGASGSPLLADLGTPVLLGVEHGMGITVGACNPPGGYDGIAPSVNRFANVPRFAANVALTRHESGSNRTQVWATDSDSGRVRTRSRKSASLTAGWQAWSDFGAVANVDRIAAMYLTNGKPQVMVTNTSGAMSYRYVDLAGNWTSWTSFGTPSGHVVRDIDAAYDGADVAHLYAVDNVAGGWAWRRRRSGTAAYSRWLDWQLLISGWVPDAYTKVSVIRRAGDLVQQAFLVTSTGAVKWMTAPFPVSTPSDFAAPAAMVDIDAGWLSDNRVFVIAVDANGGLWWRAQTPTSGSSWFGWLYYSPKAYTPDQNCANPLPPRIVSVTISRWQDDPQSTVIPVVLVTDDKGNVYYTTWEAGPCKTPSCDCGTQWHPWKSFYHSGRWADF